MTKFNQMAEALKKVTLAENLPDTSARLVNDPVTTGPDESVREDSPSVGDNEQVQQGDVSDVPRSVRGVIVGEAQADTDWMKLGDADQISLCPTFWDEEIASMRALILKKRFIREGRDRVLLLGSRVAKAWRVRGRQKFGICTLLIDGARLNVAWIPHPKKLDEYVDQLEATPYIEWVCGERDMP